MFCRGLIQKLPGMCLAHGCFTGSLLLGPLLLASMVAAEVEEDCQPRQQFTFSWQFADQCSVKPRGGTTTGPAVTLDPNPHPGWLSLQDSEISKFERDRLAILAMEGPYRTSFDFLEVAGYTDDYEPAQPYQSWATEYVYVLEDSDDFISLQHIIVMFFLEGDEISGPMVMKHWRQDWQYQKPKVLAYTGNQTWQLKNVPAEEVPGSWAQAVYQVDDSPRYESWGRWEHNPNFSSWESAKTWRPLPRRESSVREDYQVLEGTNRHSILQNGWLHEEANYKLVLGADWQPSKIPYVAKELGINRYERIVGHDFSGGDSYLEDTSKYWSDVRLIWSQIIDENQGLSLNLGVQATPLFARLFEKANEAEGYDSSAQGYDSETTRSEVREIISDYLR